MATIFVRRRPDSVMEWATEDVLDWLKELDLERFSKRFQSHLVTGPILLQMDDLLLDDLHITSIKERKILLMESRRLCLKELELVDKALEYKQKTEEIATYGSDSTKLNTTIENAQDKEESTDKLDNSLILGNLSSQDDNDVIKEFRPVANNDINYPPAGKADEVATRATLMVTILSQENSNLRAQLEQYCQKDKFNQTALEEEISTLKAENEHLKNQVRGLKMENKALISELEKLRYHYNEFQETCKKNDNEREYENKIEELKQENRFLRDKFQRFKHRAIEREVTRNLSNESNMNTSKKITASRLQSPHSNGCTGDDGQEIIKAENELKLINKVYTANKRCAELEDTVRWLYAEILHDDNKHLTHPNIQVDDEEEERAPNEPEWPSLGGRASLKVASHDESDGDFLNRFMKRGLPTDSDDNIWTTDKITTSPKGFEGSDAVLLHYWNV